MLGAEIHTLDPEFAGEAAELIKRTRIDGDSIGAAVEIVAVNVPALVGDPLYQSLKLRLMGSLGGLHAAQSVEIGAGFDVVQRRGSENNDPVRSTGYQRNSHGGLLGGITTGMPHRLPRRLQTDIDDQRAAEVDTQESGGDRLSVAEGPP